MQTRPIRPAAASLMAAVSLLTGCAADVPDAAGPAPEVGVLAPVTAPTPPPSAAPEPEASEAPQAPQVQPAPVQTPTEPDPQGCTVVTVSDAGAAAAAGLTGLSDGQALCLIGADTGGFTLHEFDGTTAGALLLEIAPDPTATDTSFALSTLGISTGGSPR